LLPVDQVEKPILIETADVAGSAPPVAQRLEGGSGIVPVAAERGSSAHDDLSGNPDRTFFPLVIEDAHLCIRERMPDGQQPALLAFAALGLVHFAGQP